jgi:hypothetical protein
MPTSGYIATDIDGYQFAAGVNGTTTISVSQDQVLIDVTTGKVQEITFKRVDSQLAEASGGIGWWHTVTSRWDEGWARSWYKPFMLSSWAYDDSTITKWYGIGFLWFLVPTHLRLHSRPARFLPYYFLFLRAVRGNIFWELGLAGLG